MDGTWRSCDVFTCACACVGAGGTKGNAVRESWLIECQPLAEQFHLEPGRVESSPRTFV